MPQMEEMLTMTESQFAKAAKNMAIRPSVATAGLVGDPLLFGRLTLDRDGNGAWAEVRLSDVAATVDNASDGRNRG